MKYLLIVLLLLIPTASYGSSAKFNLLNPKEKVKSSKFVEPPIKIEPPIKLGENQYFINPTTSTDTFPSKWFLDPQKNIKWRYLRRDVVETEPISTIQQIERIQQYIPMRGRASNC